MSEIHATARGPRPSPTGQADAETRKRIPSLLPIFVEYFMNDREAADRLRAIDAAKPLFYPPKHVGGFLTGEEHLTGEGPKQFIDDSES